MDRFDLADAIITAEALHIQRAPAEYLFGWGADYIVIAGGNQLCLHCQLRSAPWTQITAVDMGSPDVTVGLFGAP